MSEKEVNEALGSIEDGIKAQLSYYEENKDRIHENMRQNALKDPNNMQNWFPLVVSSGVPYPKTVFVDFNQGLLEDFINGQSTERTTAFLQELLKECEKMGFPCFLRGTIMSAKHSWKDSCYIPSCGTGILYEHVYKIVESNEMAWGVSQITAFAVREFIETEPAFLAFWGQMPVTKERRYFVKDGRVVCHHPYWPGLSIQSPIPVAGEVPKDPNWWKPLLAKLNEESDLDHDDEVGYLTGLAEKIGAVAPGSWSIGFLQDKNRNWYCIDMAVAEESFHWPECPNAPERMKRYLEKEKTEADFNDLIEPIDEANKRED